VVMEKDGEVKEGEGRGREGGGALKVSFSSGLIHLVMSAC